MTPEALLHAALVCLLAIAAVVLWLAMAIWVYIDAARRGAPAGWWAVGVLACGPFGFVAYLIDRPGTRLVRCPFCHEIVDESNIRCPFCSRHISKGPPGPSSLP